MPEVYSYITFNVGTNMKLLEHRKAVALRKQGRSLKEIAEALRVSKSTVSLWVTNVPLTKAAQKRIRSLYTNGQIASQESHWAATRLKEKIVQEEAIKVLARFPTQKEVKQVICSLMYWCEGAKLYRNRGSFCFTNSDPTLVASFLSLLRDSYDIDESKFHPAIHIHGYHDEATQLKFWSKVTSIPVGQFIRSYRKPESGINIREGYQGCVQIRYYDKMVLRQILAIAREFLKKTGP
jgi:transposase